MAFQPSEPHRLVFADALRAFAISLVVLSHLPIVVPHLTSGELGSWGVNCFFILSGFLLAGPYLRALLDPSRPWPSTRLFLTRRFLRIYPLYAVGVVVSCALVALAGRPFPSATDIVSHLLMLQGLSSYTVEGLNAPLWTMPVDGAFYLAMPALAYVLSCALRGRSRETRFVTIAAALAGAIVLGLLWRSLACNLVPLVLTESQKRVQLIQDALGMAPAFAIGIGLALFPRVQTSDRAVRVAVGAALTIALAGLVALHKLPFLDSSGTAPVFHVVFRDFAAAVSVGGVVFALEHLPSAVALMALSRVVTWFASLAYAVYLFHYPILQVVRHLFGGATGRFVTTEETLLALAVTLTVAWLAHRFVEQPFLDMKDRRREPVPSAAPGITALATAPAEQEAPLRRARG